MWSTRREIGSGIYLSGVTFLVLGILLWPEVLIGVVGLLFAAYTLVGAALMYRSFRRHRMPIVTAALSTLASGLVIAMLSYGLGLLLSGAAVQSQ